MFRPALRSLLPAGPALALALLLASPAAALDLLGTWYVLVHYRDSATANPDVWRWDDRVWVFEERGSRVRWTEYPIVVFDDETGRFEGRHRVLAAWEPGEAQWEEVRSGLQVNSRGSKSKSLRPERDGSAWETVGRMSVTSASAIGYFEDWNVADPHGLPVFTRDDVLGSARAEGLEGRTRYTTTEVLAGGDELRGKFERDGTRVGAFRMVRSGERRGIETAAKTQQERFEKERDRVIRAAREQQAERARRGEPLGEDGEFPFIGASLKEVFDAMRERPDEDSRVLVQKLVIFRVDGNDAEDWQEVSEEEALANAEDAEYAIAVNRLCTSTELTPEQYSWRSSDWFLMSEDRLRAYDYTYLGPLCSGSLEFSPATPEWAAVEDRLTGWMASNFPRGITSKAQIYARGRAYAFAGRLDKAKEMLVAGDEAFEQTTRLGTVVRRGPAQGDLRLAGESENEEQRRLLVEEIRRAGGEAYELDSAAP